MTDWNDQRKLEHSESMALKLMDKYPELSDIWLASADIIRNRIARNKEVHNND